MPISLGAAGLIGGGTLLSGLFGGLVGNSQVNAQERANSENMRLNRELLAFQKYQYEDQKRYNSVTEQARRMRAAGLNPALLMQNGTIGSSISSIGAPSMTAMQAPDYSTIGSAVNAFGTTASSLADSLSQVGVNSATKENLEADTAGKLIDNFFASDSWRSRIERWGSETMRNKSLSAVADLEKTYLSNTLNYRIKQQEFKMETEAANMFAAQIAQSYLPEQIQAEIGLKLAQAKMSVDMGVASVKQALASVMDAVSRRMQTTSTYGFSEVDRANFFNQSMNLLSSQVGVNNSTEFKNLRTPWSTSAGSKLFGSISHTTTEGHYSEYNNWKSGKHSYRTKGKK